MQAAVIFPEDNQEIKYNDRLINTNMEPFPHLGEIIRHANFVFYLGYLRANTKL